MNRTSLALAAMLIGATISPASADFISGTVHLDLSAVGSGDGNYLCEEVCGGTTLSFSLDTNDAQSFSFAPIYQGSTFTAFSIFEGETPVSYFRNVDFTWTGESLSVFYDEEGWYDLGGDLSSAWNILAFETIPGSLGSWDTEWITPGGTAGLEFPYFTVTSSDFTVQSAPSQTAARTAVPEPGTLPLFLAALIALGGTMKWSQRRAKVEFDSHPLHHLTFPSLSVICTDMSTHLKRPRDTRMRRIIRPHRRIHVS